MLAFLLMTAWAGTLPDSMPQADSLHATSLGADIDARASSYRRDIVGQLTSATMLAALGFLLAMRQGALDLSIWAVMGISGMAAAGLINAGAPAWLGVAGGAALGVAIGGLNALFVAGLRLPSMVITPLMGLGIVLLAGPLTSVREILLRPDAFDTWVRVVHVMFGGRAAPAAPLLTARMFLVAAAWVAVLSVLVGRYHFTFASNDWRQARRPALALALLVSGGLAGLAGSVWLLDQGYAPVPRRPIDGLAIPTVAILAGGVLLVGRERTILACICLPVAALLVSLWRQVAPPVPVLGFDGSLVILLVMVVGLNLSVIWAISCHRSDRRIFPWIAAGVMVAALLLAALTFRWELAASWRGMQWAMVVWGVGGIMCAASVLQAVVKLTREAD